MTTETETTYQVTNPPIYQFTNLPVYQSTESEVNP